MEPSNTESNSTNSTNNQTDITTNTPISSNEQKVTANQNNRMLFGILAYLGILVVIPYLMAKDDEFVFYHVKQGIVICGVWLILWVAGNMVFMLWPLISIINIGLLVLAIVGIIKVVQNKKEPLPIIGSFAEKLSL